ncbi:MAG: hypothetical protein QOF14_1729 [Hyphomicrobiales bacterium]|jgi:hypothetical protein|nr:hypothetical protein [Hyphomicrobiales bacterium]
MRNDAAGSETDLNAGAKEALDHAWNWFELHSSQRMQTFRFFLIATAFLAAGYGSLLEKHHHVAMGIALVGAWLSVWFSLLDQRTSDMIKASENVLQQLQAQLADRYKIDDLKIVEKVEQGRYGGASHRVVIAVIQWTLFTMFLLAAAYAFCLGA